MQHGRARIGSQQRDGINKNHHPAGNLPKHGHTLSERELNEGAFRHASSVNFQASMIFLVPGEAGAIFSSKRAGSPEILSGRKSTSRGVPPAETSFVAY
jgi:hypothetical protein